MEESKVKEPNERDWIGKMELLLGLMEEATEFLQRTQQRFPQAIPSHTFAIACLWDEANSLDQQICSHLDEMNQRLMRGEGELEVTRGASVRNLMVGEDLLFYDCMWSLFWEERQRGISVRLSVEPQLGSYHTRVEGLTTYITSDIRHPVQEEQLREALTKTYISEMTML